MANVFVCTGRLCKDVEIRYTTGDKPTCVANFTIAVDNWTPKGKGADFLRITAFGKVAENMERYCSKGMMLGVTGSVHSGSYERDGKKVYVTNINADKVDFLSKSEKTEEEQQSISKPPTGFTYADDIPFD